MKTISRLLAGIALAVVSLAACQDDELISVPQPSGPSTNIGTRATNATSSLVQNEDGTWTATRRVPLVGRGRIVDDINSGLVTVLTAANNVGNVTDISLDNAMAFTGVAEIKTGEPFLSVRDLDRTYYNPNGIKAGFVYRETSDFTLADVSVLQGFWIKTFLNGKEQESSLSEAPADTRLLQLQLLNTSGGLREASFVATKAFDEIQIGGTGIEIDVLGGLEVCYAFVGENPEKIAADKHEYPDATSDGSPLHGLLVDENITTNGPVVELVGSLFGGPNYTISFNTEDEIPVGSEIGFKTKSGGLLALKAGGVKLTLYGEGGNELESMSTTAGIGVSALGGGENYISMVCTKPGCKKVNIDFPWGLDVLNGTQVFYAYTRDPVTIDASSYFSASDVTITGNSYTLPTPEGKQANWVCLSFTPDNPDENATPSFVQKDGTTKIIGMTADGKYLLSGTYVPEEGDPISITFTITRKALTMDDQCNQSIGVAEEAKIAQGGLGGVSGALVNIIEGASDLKYIVDDNPNTFAKYTSVAQIAANSLIVPIELGKTMNENHEEIKVGFTMQTAFDFLSADVLKFFVIKLYNDGKRVDDGPVDQSNIADVGLIGSTGNKFRIGITTTEAFDRIELWTAGILNLGISEYRIYDAYWENADADCPTYGLADACMEMLTSANGAEIDWDNTANGEALASVGASLNDLGNLLDEDKESCATITATTVLGETAVAVKFDEMTGPKQIGFIVKSPDYIGDIEALGETVLEVYNNGTKVKTLSEGALADIGLIGYTDRTYVEATIEKGVAFDEVRIVFPTVLNALKTIELYGAYIRRDSDGNGIPDCADDDENQGGTDEVISGAHAASEHVCEPENVIIKVDEGSGTQGNTYKLICYNSTNHNEQTELFAVLDEQNQFTISGLTPGEYYIGIYSGNTPLYNGIRAFVHPAETTWKKEGTTRGEWNNWNNWTNGAPWSCTNVIIPGGCSDYPVLTATEDNYCANLHIGAGAELVNTQYLTGYDYAWVELSLQANNYYMLSAPLQSMATGDMFVPSGWNFGNAQPEYFTKLTPMNAPESRFTPRVYQRFWSSEVPGMVIDGEGNLKEEILVSETDWTAPFNAVAEPYAKGMGFSLRANNAATFRFPKTHEEYTYFDAAGNSTGQRESVGRRNVGRFWTDSWTSAGDFTVTVANRTAGTTFVVGNPFMAHISIEQLLKANTGIKAVRLNDGNANATIMLADDGTLATENGYTYIAPMQAFYVDVETESTTLTVNFNTGMLSAQPGYQIVSAQDNGAKTRALTRSAAAADGTPRNTLRLTATCNGRSSSCLVRLHPTANDGYLGGEDSRLLIDGDMPPTVAVFTTADGLALDIQQRSSREDIPVSFRLPKAGHVTLALSHQAGDDWSQWTLVDSRTGQRYPLEDGYTHIDLGTLDTCAGRFYLEH